MYAQPSSNVCPSHVHYNMTKSGQYPVYVFLAWPFNVLSQIQVWWQYMMRRHKLGPYKKKKKKGKGSGKKKGKKGGKKKKK